MIRLSFCSLLSGLAFAAAGPGQALPFAELRQMLPRSGSDTWSIAVGDIDGDGDPDVVAGNTGADELLRNAGGGRFVLDPAALPMDADPIGGLALGDLDGDLDLDLYVANGRAFQTPAPDRVYRNDGAGRFAELAGAVPGPARPSTGVVLGDVDGDGDLDALVTHAGFCDVTGCIPGEARFYRNDGTGRFADATAAVLILPVRNGSYLSAELGDLDGDRDIDAVLSVSLPPAGGSSVLLRNDGQSRLVEDATSIAFGRDTSFDLELADIDGDGDLDLLEACGEWDGHGAPDRLLLNDGAGRLLTEIWPWGSSGCTNGLASGDIDADGDLDVLVGDRQTLSGPNAVVMNEGAGSFRVALDRLPPWREVTRAVELVDVDGDADLDALVFGEGPDHLHLNDGTGRFIEAWSSLPPTSLGAGAVAVADFDGDGHLDLLTGGTGAGTMPYRANYNLRGLGSGVFESAPNALPALPSDASAIELGDVDGDGALDALVADTAFGGRPGLWLGDGRGSFHDASAGLPSGVTESRDAALADLDGDRDLDVLFANAGPAALWLGDGRGGYADASVGLPSPSHRATDLALADVDGDSDLDATFATELGARFWLNDGHGHFADSSASVPWAGIYLSALALLDLDRDGDPDLVASGAMGCELAANDGHGRFAVIPGAVPSIAYASGIFAGDAEPDSDPDLLLGTPPRSLVAVPYLLVNDGAGRFPTQIELPMNRQGLNAAVMVDLDHDGDTDLLAAPAGGPWRLFHGRGIQVATTALPRLGQRLEIELAGAPSSPWELVLGLGTAYVPLPPLGVLLLDPRGMLAATCGAFDAQGTSAIAPQIPADLAFLGLPFAWQMLQHGPLRLSNLELTVPLRL